MDSTCFASGLARDLINVCLAWMYTFYLLSYLAGRLVTFTKPDQVAGQLLPDLAMNLDIFYLAWPGHWLTLTWPVRKAK